MTDETFNKISSKELSGFKAFVTGRISLKGDLGMLTKFEKEVINKYKHLDQWIKKEIG